MSHTSLGYIYSDDKMQLEQAVTCGVSGTLAEWPFLLRALKRRGFTATVHTPGSVAREMAAKALGAESPAKRLKRDLREMRKARDAGKGKG